MSHRPISYTLLSFHFNPRPGRLAILRHLSWRTLSFVSPHPIANINATTAKRTLFIHQAAKIAQTNSFRQLCELEAAAIPFERRRDAAKVRLAQAAVMDTYNFPDYRLKKKMDDPSKTPLLLVACGSFSPITFLHLRMFIMAGDYVKFSTDFEIVGGYLSPVSDAYKKVGLATAEHRVAMCQLAIDRASNWLMVDTWEAEKKEYQPTAVVLDHFENEINTIRKGIDDGNGNRKPIRIALLAGADLIQTMSTPGVWSEKDLDHILGRYGTFIVERSGTDIDDALSNLQPWQDKIYVIQQLIQNDVSSTKIRLFLRRGMSVQYLIPAPVVEYIEQNHLFDDDGRASSTHSVNQDSDKGKAKEVATSA